MLLSAEGWSASLIAKSQLIDETMVRRHLHDWLNDKKLKPENGIFASHLSEAKIAEFITHLTNNILPTTHAIIALADEWWGIRYTVLGMNKWLHCNDFSYKTPIGVNRHRFPRLLYTSRATTRSSRADCLRKTECRSRKALYHGNPPKISGDYSYKKFKPGYVEMGIQKNKKSIH